MTIASSEAVALERHERDEQVRAERELAMVGRGAVGENAPATTLSPSFTIGLWWMSVPWFERMNLIRSPYRATCPRPRCDSRRARSRRRALRHDHVARVDGGAVLRPAPTSGARGIISGTACRCMFALLSAGSRRCCEERDHRGRDRDDLRRRDVHELDLLRSGHDSLALAGAAEHVLVHEPACLRRPARRPALIV